MRVIRPIGPRVPLIAALGLAWLNFLLTVKWAYIPGALNGPKRPWYAAALAVATVLAFASRRLGRRAAPVAVWPLTAIAWALLVIGFLLCLPPATWSLTPFFDDWPPRLVATVQGLRLAMQGAVTGWEWNLLGGYQTSADLSQNLTVLGALPLTLFGSAVGYHLLHAGLFAAIPLLVWLDLTAEEPADVARLGSALVVLGVVGYYGTIMTSGDTNSIAGVFCAVLALTGSRLARRGARWGGAVLALGLTLALYTHAGFFVYTCVYLVLEAAYYRRGRHLVRLVAAASVAAVAALPVYWELLRYPSYFATNNVVYAAGTIDWLDAVRRVYYSVELLAQPHRWFNDSYGLARVFLPVLGWVAWRARPARSGFYALAATATVAMMMIDVPAVTGYLFSRSLHMLAVLAPVPIAWFIVEQAGSRAMATALALVAALYVHAAMNPVPHVADIRDFDRGLVERVEQVDGALVLVEGNPHRDLIPDPGERTERTPFGIHFESLLAEATGRRLYAQTWDGWHWTPFRGQTVAAGSFRGAPIRATPVAEFADEMRRWGVRHLLVWSEATRAYLDAAPDYFTERWASGRWRDYEFAQADSHDVVVQGGGEGALGDRHPLGGKVALDGVTAGARVVVRMNYFPAWRAEVDGVPIALEAERGQLAFSAPRDGSYVVSLVYPARRGLVAFSVLAFLAGAIGLRRL